MEVPRSERLPGARGFALTVDVEEWYHTCVVPDYVHPERRPELEEELDWLLPELLDLIEEAGCRATFFVLGEVAEKHPRRVREIVERGHEVGSHDRLHIRAAERSPEEFRQDLRRSLAILGDLCGQEIRGYRAPEWSLRKASNPRLRIVAEEGLHYDSSLAPYLGAGSLANHRYPHRLRWQDGISISELPPLTFGGWLRLPAGSWPGRLAPAETLVRAARTQKEKRGVAVMVIHPWEVSGRPTPGSLEGWASFIHETGREGYRERVGKLLKAHPWETLGDVLSASAEV